MTSPWNDCNAAVKPYYYPVEAAIRWCGLTDHEAVILANMGFPTAGEILPPHYSEWPCLRQRAELIVDAMACGELPHSRDGSLPDPDDHVAKPRRTVRHNDLKAWMATHHPGQKPPFLFDETERATHGAITTAAYDALKAEADRAKAENERLKANLRSVTAQRDQLIGERDSLAAIVQQAAPPGERAETTYANIIGGPLGPLLGKSDSGKPQSVFTSQEAIISALLHKYPDAPGIAESTLKGRFAAARKSINQS